MCYHDKTPPLPPLPTNNNKTGTTGQTDGSVLADVHGTQRPGYTNYTKQRRERASNANPRNLVAVSPQHGTRQCAAKPCFGTVRYAPATLARPMRGVERVVTLQLL